MASDQSSDITELVSDPEAIEFNRKCLISFSGLCSRRLQRLSKGLSRSKGLWATAFLPSPCASKAISWNWAMRLYLSSENPRLHKMAWKEWGNLENCLGKKARQINYKQFAVNFWQCPLSGMQKDSPKVTLSLPETCSWLSTARAPTYLPPVSCHARPGLEDLSFTHGDQV